MSATERGIGSATLRGAVVSTPINGGDGNNQLIGYEIEESRRGIMVGNREENRMMEYTVATGSGQDKNRDGAANDGDSNNNMMDTSTTTVNACARALTVVNRICNERACNRKLVYQLYKRVRDVIDDALRRIDAELSRGRNLKRHPHSVVYRIGMPIALDRLDDETRAYTAEVRDNRDGAVPLRNFVIDRAVDVIRRLQDSRRADTLAVVDGVVEACLVYQISIQSLLSLRNYLVAQSARFDDLHAIYDKQLYTYEQLRLDTAEGEKGINDNFSNALYLENTANRGNNSNSNSGDNGDNGNDDEYDDGNSSARRGGALLVRYDRVGNAERKVTTVVGYRSDNNNDVITNDNRDRDNGISSSSLFSGNDNRVAAATTDASVIGASANANAVCATTNVVNDNNANQMIPPSESILSNNRIAMIMGQINNTQDLLDEQRIVIQRLINQTPYFIGPVREEHDFMDLYGGNDDTEIIHAFLTSDYIRGEVARNGSETLRTAYKKVKHYWRDFDYREDENVNNNSSSNSSSTNYGNNNSNSNSGSGGGRSGGNRGIGVTNTRSNSSLTSSSAASSSISPSNALSAIHRRVQNVATINRYRRNPNASRIM